MGFVETKLKKHTLEHPGKHHLSGDPNQFYKTLKVFFSSIGILSSEILDDQYLKVIVPYNSKNSNFLEKIFYESNMQKNFYTSSFLKRVVSKMEKDIIKYDTLFPRVFWFYDMCKRVLKKLNFWKDSVLKNKKRTLEIIEFYSPPDDVRPPEISDEGENPFDYMDADSSKEGQVYMKDSDTVDLNPEITDYFQDNFSLMEIGVKLPIIYNISTNHMERIYEEYYSKYEGLREKLHGLNWNSKKEKNEAIINYENQSKKGSKVYNKKLKSKRKSRRHKIKIITKPKTRRAKKSSNLMKDKKKGVKTKKTKNKTKTKTKKRKKSKSKLPISKKMHHKAIKKGGGGFESLNNFVKKSYNQLLVLLNLRDEEDPSASVPLLIDLNNSIKGPEFPYIHELIKNKGFVCLIVTPFTPMTKIEKAALRKYKGLRDVNIGKVYIIKAEDNFKGLKITGSKQLIKAKMITDSKDTERTLYETSHIQYGDRNFIGLGFDEKIEAPLGGDGTLSNGPQSNPGIFISQNLTKSINISNIGTIYIVKPYNDSWVLSDRFLDWDMYGFIRNAIGKKTCEGRKTFILFCMDYSRYFDNYVNGFKRNPDTYFEPGSILDNYILKQYQHLRDDDKPNAPSWWVSLNTKREIFKVKTKQLIEGLTQGYACKSDIVVLGDEFKHRYFRGIKDMWIYPFDQNGQYKENGFFSVSKSSDIAADFSRSKGVGQGHICIIWKVDENMPYIVMDEEKSRLPEEKEVVFQSPIIELIWDPCGFYNDDDWEKKWQDPGEWRVSQTEFLNTSVPKNILEKYKQDENSMRSWFDFFRTRYQKKVIFVELKYDDNDKANHEERRRKKCTPVEKLIGIVADEYVP